MARLRELQLISKNHGKNSQLLWQASMRKWKAMTNNVLCTTVLFVDLITKNPDLPDSWCFSKKWEFQLLLEGRRLQPQVPWDFHLTSLASL